MPMAGALLIGLDAGTTSCKAALVDGSGALLATASASYPLSRPQPGYVEQDPEDYWIAAVHCIRELLASPRADRSQIVALSSCGHAPTMVLLEGRDASARPVRPAILWQDTRAVAEAEALARDPGTDVLAEWQGLRWPVDASMPLARFRWLERYEPETLRNAEVVLLPKDLIHLRLTGRAATDVWSAKGLVHQGTLQPIPQLSELSEVRQSAIPEAMPASGVVGRVTRAASETTGLPEGIIVVAGWTDAMAAMLGTGALGTPGLACDVSGTSEVVGLTVASRPEDTGALITARIVSSGNWMLYGPTQASGASLGWALQTLGGGTLAPEAALAEAATTPPGADGLVFLPYLQGERAPLWDPRARGAFVGLSSSHQRAHLLRAVLEGVGCSVRHVLSLAEQIDGARALEVRVAGGGARLAPWNQIKADITGRVMRPCATSENGVLGAAMLAALGSGLFADVAAAGEAMVQLLDRVLPDPEQHDRYERLFARYVALYPRLQELFS